MDRREAWQLAQQLKRQWLHGQGWKLQWDNAARRFGSCDWRTKTITMSRHLVELNSREEVEDMIRHEIAHALAGSRAGHGDKWRSNAALVGARPERCYNGQKVAAPPRKWKGTCPRCGRTSLRHRRLDISCGSCSRQYDPELRLIWAEALEEVDR